MSFEQQRRNSSRGHAFPRSLELQQRDGKVRPPFSKESHDIGMATPPASGVPSSAKHFIFGHRRGQSSLHMPLTPASPVVAPGTQTLDQVVEAEELEEKSKIVGGLQVAAPAAASTSDTVADLSASTGTTSRKRSLSPTHASTSQRPTKRQSVEPSDLIENPIVDLARLEVPVAYVRMALQARLRQHFGVTETAACYIRARPLSHPSKGLRVRVIPRRDPSRAWTCHFNRPRSSIKRQAGKEEDLDDDDVEDDVRGRRPIDLPPSRPLRHDLSPTSDSDLSSASAAEYDDEDGSERPSFAVHVEALLARAQPLYELLLSGKVLRGDTLELALPFPDALPTLVKWLYVGCEGCLADGDTTDPRDEAMLNANALQIWAVV